MTVACCKRSDSGASEELLSQLPALRNPILSLRLKSAWESAQLLLDLLGGDGQIQVAGAARRMCETVVGGLDLVALVQDGDAALLELLERLPPVVNVTARTSTSATVRLYDGLEVRLFLATRETWGGATAVAHRLRRAPRPLAIAGGNTRTASDA